MTIVFEYSKQRLSQNYFSNFVAASQQEKLIIYQLDDHFRGNCPENNLTIELQQTQTHIFRPASHILNLRVEHILLGIHKTLG